MRNFNQERYEILYEAWWHEQGNNSAPPIPPSPDQLFDFIGWMLYRKVEEPEKKESLTGLYAKYRIFRSDTGQEIDGPAFVLRYDRDPEALKALVAYANGIWLDNIRLAGELFLEAAAALERHPDWTVY